MRCKILLLLLLSEVISFGQTLFPIVLNGPSSNRVNVVFIAEGFRNVEDPKFRAACTNVYNKFKITAPYSNYIKLLNFYGIMVDSVESGSDHPSSGVYKNTYFNSSYDSWGTTRLLTIPPNNFNASSAGGTWKVTLLLNSLMPEWDIVILLVNDTTYGGSGGTFAVSSLHPSSPDIALHETGHGFAKLGDEYTTAYPGYHLREEPNTTTNKTRDTLKWNVWVKASTPIPTPNGTYTSEIGLFEGAHYHMTGWYRPKNDCGMKSLGVVFCEVCQETIIKTIYARLKIIEGRFPTSGSFTFPPEGLSFSVSSIIPTNTAVFTWYLNDGILSTNKHLTLTAADVNLGTNKVTAIVRDRSSKLRINIEDRTEWIVIKDIGSPEMPEIPRVELLIKKK